ncbi:DUF3857 domain-containing protein [Salinimicrobium soli]|uniref:DUF3857 domain-containing protein n=1 Tax=Salinimicrobium soli TaxID=1254399 RepID=UPI003AAC5858
MRKFLSFVLLGLLTSLLSAQEISYAALLIDDPLLDNANAVVRYSYKEVRIEAIDKMRILTKTVVTVLNERGDRYGFVGNAYSDNIKIKEQKAFIYDGLGQQVRKYKQRDFDDRSLVSSNDLYSDDRLSYLEYTPQEYPYTIVFESEVVTDNTAFVRDWDPVPGYHISVEEANFSFKNLAKIPFRYKEENFEGMKIEKDSTEFELNYELSKLPAYDYEELSPDLEDFTPLVQIALNEFSLAGVKGRARNWKELGEWQFNNLLTANDPLPESTITRINKLTATAESDIDKARIIYEYMQENSRYISVQLGIGGWSPMPAADVDELKYGDCKALTNYTRTLLASQGIESYYTVVSAGEEKKSMDTDFASMEGNHVILNIPQEEGEDIWLECTSQTHPFNYLGDFTDDRNVLLIKPEGGELVKTPSYTATDNVRETSSEIQLLEDGAFKAVVQRKSRGTTYGDIYGINTISEKDQVLYYKKNWGHLKGLDVEKVTYYNDKDQKEFTEELQLSGQKLSSKAGNILLLPLNFLPLKTYRLPHKEKRNFPIEISRGRTYIDTFQYILPEGFVAESVPENVLIENRFGSFEIQNELKPGEKNVLEVVRKYQLNEGLWPAESYEEFQSFMNSLNSLSNQKAVISKTNQP